MNTLYQKPLSPYPDCLFTIDSLIEVLEDISSWHLLDEMHGERVSDMSLKIAARLSPGFSAEKMTLLDYAARIHDLGRIAIDDGIMTKPGPLTESERGAAETHVVIGHRFLMRSGLPQEIKDVVLYHHEHFDGSGYPTKSTGNSIPLFARIVTIADVFDALVSDRPYRKSMEIPAALNTMNSNISWFDPHLYSVFLRVLQEQEQG